MTPFEKSLLDFLATLRKEIASVETIPDITFSIRVNGRVDSEWNVAFRLERTYDNSANCEGGNLNAVIDEFIHRHSWAQRNAPLCLPSVPTIEHKDDDGIHF